MYINCTLSYLQITPPQRDNMNWLSEKLLRCDVGSDRLVFFPVAYSNISRKKRKTKNKERKKKKNKSSKQELVLSLLACVCTTQKNTQTQFCCQEWGREEAGNSRRKPRRYEPFRRSALRMEAHWPVRNRTSEKSSDLRKFTNSVVVIRAQLFHFLGLSPLH